MRPESPTVPPPSVEIRRDYAAEATGCLVPLWFLLILIFAGLYVLR